MAALSGSVDVALNRLALRFDRPAEADFEADATLRQVSVTLKALPGPLGVASGSMRFDGSGARYEKLAVAMLDARALLSGTATLKGPHVEFALAQGDIGEKAVQLGARAREGAGAPRAENAAALRGAAHRVGAGGAAGGRRARRLRGRPALGDRAGVEAEAAGAAPHRDQGRSAATPCSALASPAT